jgi:hypothetical protein
VKLWIPAELAVLIGANLDTPAYYEERQSNSTPIVEVPCQISDYVRSKIDGPANDPSRSEKTPRIVNAARLERLSIGETLYCVLQAPDQVERYAEKGKPYMYDDIRDLYDSASEPPEDIPLLDDQEDNGKAVAPGGIRAFKASELTPARQTKWIANGRIPCSAVTLLVGDENIGKSMWWAWLVAILTTGRGFKPFGIPPREPMNVCLILTEDDWATEVRPRLEVAGADLSRISVLCEESDGSGAPQFPRDIAKIPEGTDLTLVDAWLDTVPANINVKDPQQARQALQPWKEHCTRTESAVILLTHTNRLSTGNARDKYGISAELRKKARMTLFVQEDEDSGPGGFTVGPEKANGTTTRKATIFTKESVQVFEPTDDNNGGTVGRVVWKGESDHTARERITAQWEESQAPVETKDCAKWLQNYLDNCHGSATATEVQKAAHAEGFTSYAIKSGKLKQRIKSEKVGDTWVWKSTT